MSDPYKNICLIFVQMEKVARGKQKARDKEFEKGVH